MPTSSASCRPAARSSKCSDCSGGLGGQGSSGVPSTEPSTSIQRPPSRQPDRMLEAIASPKQNRTRIVGPSKTDWRSVLTYGKSGALGYSTVGNPTRQRKIGIEKALDVAVQHALEVAHVVAGAGVLDALIGMQEVVANLRAEAGLGLFLVLGGLRGFAFFFFQPGQPGPQHLERRGPVLVLRALVLALHDDVRGQVREADGARGLVDVLAAGAAGPKHILANVLVAQSRSRPRR